MLNARKMNLLKLFVYKCVCLPKPVGRKDMVSWDMNDIQNESFPNMKPKVIRINAVCFT